MIIKGKSRAGPSQLARHLARADTNERVEILQLDSAGTTAEAFRDWQTYTLATRGVLGLYHANIDPDARYEMTPEQWTRAVDILEEELCLQGQPRAVVLHEKQGRQHVHVVWARCDMNTLTLRSDSKNYHAHERASLRMEQEFGHELVPGKHAKRDREKQPEFPRAGVSHDEWQQAERGRMDHTQRKAQITALFEASDHGPAFRSALEDAGYVLARGDKADFMILDADAKAYSLVRQLPGVKTADLRAFMVEVDPSALPSVKEARVLVRDRSPQPEPTPEPEPASIPAQGPEIAARLDALRRGLEARHAKERGVQEDTQAAEVARLQAQQEAEAKAAIEALARAQTRAVAAAQGVIEGRWEALSRKVHEALAPEVKAARLDQQRQEAEDRDRAHRQDMEAMLAVMETRHRAEIAALITRQAEARADLQRRHAEEIAQHLAEAARIAEREREIERQREIELQRQEALARSRDGPEDDGRAR